MWEGGRMGESGSKHEQKVVIVEAEWGVPGSLLLSTFACVGDFPRYSVKGTQLQGYTCIMLTSLIDTPKEGGIIVTRCHLDLSLL